MIWPMSCLIKVVWWLLNIRQGIIHKHALICTHFHLLCLSTLCIALPHTVVVYEEIKNEYYMFHEYNMPWKNLYSTREKKDVDAINWKALYGSAMKFTSLTNKQYTLSTVSIYLCKYFDIFLVLCHLHLLYACVYC